MSTGDDVASIVAKVLACGALIGCIVIGVLGNGVMCLLVNRKAAMRSAINLLLTSISVSNLLLSTICLPLLVTTVALEKWIFGHTVSRLVASLNALFVAASVNALLAISLDRYLIIVRRKDKLTPERAKGLIAAMWGLAVVVALPPAVGGGLYYPYSMWGAQCTQPADLGYVIVLDLVLFFLPMIVMMYAYVCIIQSVRHNLSQVFNLRESHAPNTLPSPVFTKGACSSSPGHIAAITVSPSTSAAPASVAVSASASRTHRPHPASTHRCRASQRINYVDINFKTRSFRTIFILFVVFVVCWLPFSVAILVANIRASTMTSTTMTQQNCAVMANTDIIPQLFNVIADTTMTQHRYDVTAVTATKQNNYDVMVDTKATKQNNYDVMVDTKATKQNNYDVIAVTTMKQNNYDVMAVTTMKQNHYDVNKHTMPTQNINFYNAAVWMTTEKSNFDVTEDDEVTEHNCNVTDETTTTTRDNSDVTMTLKQSSELQGAAMVALVTLCLGCVNCAINPFVFWFQIHKYRSACLEYLRCTSANSDGKCSCYCGSLAMHAIDICGMDLEGLPPPRLSFRTRRQIHPDAAYKCTDENEDTTAT